ncbi:hypothetical protein D3C73_1097700 [compost metagenome]
MNFRRQICGCQRVGINRRDLSILINESCTTNLSFTHAIILLDRTAVLLIGNAEQNILIIEQINLASIGASRCRRGIPQHGAFREVNDNRILESAQLARGIQRRLKLSSLQYFIRIRDAE